jgi:hypothetical protein
MPMKFFQICSRQMEKFPGTSKFDPVEAGKTLGRVSRTPDFFAKAPRKDG